MLIHRPTTCLIQCYVARSSAIFRRDAERLLVEVPSAREKRGTPAWSWLWATDGFMFSCELRSHYF